jgi:hypothetical protein
MKVNRKFRLGIIGGCKEGSDSTPIWRISKNGFAAFACRGCFFIRASLQNRPGLLSATVAMGASVFAIFV